MLRVSLMRRTRGIAPERSTIFAVMPVPALSHAQVVAGDTASVQVLLNGGVLNPTTVAVRDNVAFLAEGQLSLIGQVANSRCSPSALPRTGCSRSRSTRSSSSESSRSSVSWCSSRVRHGNVLHDLGRGIAFCFIGWRSSWSMTLHALPAPLRDLLLRVGRTGLVRARCSDAIQTPGAPASE
jgi:hypothetical protein